MLHNWHYGITALTLTTRRFQLLAQPMFYHTVVLAGSHQGLLLVIVQKPHLATYVRNLVFFEAKDKPYRRDRRRQDLVWAAFYNRDPWLAEYYTPHNPSPALRSSHYRLGKDFSDSSRIQGREVEFYDGPSIFSDILSFLFPNGVLDVRTLVRLSPLRDNRNTRPRWHQASPLGPSTLPSRLPSSHLTNSMVTVIPVIPVAAAPKLAEILTVVGSLEGAYASLVEDPDNTPPIDLSKYIVSLTSLGCIPCALAYM
ncbi:hypothetical protein BJY01DRAFT_253307 [Aspergillus pseudoustus]|uniref:Uncharacterized protein n=1 Tax=Aspergillus pseudoustus TaxID=1810923 RepID=A0ABR4J1L1_9EURO